MPPDRPALPSLPDFYGAVIDEAVVGPRYEVTLLVELWPRVEGRRANQFRRGGGPRIRIRIGDIANVEPVERFFTHWERSPNSAAGLHYLRYAIGKPSRPGRRFLELEFDGSGDQLQIECRSLTMWSDE